MTDLAALVSAADRDLHRAPGTVRRAYKALLDAWINGQVHQPTPVILTERETRNRAIREASARIREEERSPKLDHAKRLGAKRLLIEQEPELFAEDPDLDEDVGDLWVALVLSRRDHDERFKRLEDEAATLEARVRELETATFTDREGM